MVRYYIGTSGWHYDDWTGCFYPENLPKSRWLEFYARHFPTVELNNTFYRLPAENTFRKWYESSPVGFLFAVKVSRYITHIRRLKNCRQEISNFMSRAVVLREKLGVLLYQLPPGLHRDNSRLEEFLGFLPQGFRHAIEFRHHSWFHEETYALLRRHKVALCIFDMPGFTSPTAITADFGYVRFHGGESLYSSRYTEEAMKRWAETIAGLGESLDTIYIYFNNDVAGYAVENAMMLRRYLEKDI
ncbi:MAG: DUF72 domain-containing protein [Dehalococcoidales bacterium]|nr:DUF72 domain-containing protein [Dehalococcoidales bacterium]